MSITAHSSVGEEKQMKDQGTQIRSVVYDARTRRFEADVSFLDIRGMQRRYHVTAPGTPDLEHDRIVDSLLKAAKNPRRFAKGSKK